jgi:DNA mismatch repair protein MutL
MTIRLLDSATVNQIAAGEVVERPASVVKELVENAIDSGAQSIRIDLSSNGEIKTIRVTDDGSGMSHDEVRLAFTSHATSKITIIDDLYHIHTLGFRGEALASIAAVSRVTLVTKTGGGSAGTKIVIEGGEIKEHVATGAPVGTSVLVENLFFNTPARKKFQKSKNTELAHIHSIMEGICLANPDISFRLYNNHHEQLVTERSSDITDTIARIYGEDITRDLVPVSSTMPFMSITGWIAPPSRARKDNARMIVAVNQRYISSPIINAAIREGYGTLLPKDKFPVTFLRLEINTELVDVNVHPAKKLVRLTKEREISDAIKKAVKNTLLTHDLVPAVDVSPRAGESLRVKHSRIPVTMYRHEDKPRGVNETNHAGTITTDRQLRQTELTTGTPQVNPLVPYMDVIGQFGGIYIVATTKTGELLLIDQHAAHERILYEIVKRKSQGRWMSQELLVPLVLHQTAKEAALLRDLIHLLENEGLVLEEFGRDSFIVRAIPAALGRSDETAVVMEIIEDLITENRSRGYDEQERITRIIACRGAIKAGTVCSREQCQRVIDQLRLAENPFTCPHGRPTMIRFTRAELDAMFKRT